MKKRESQKLIMSAIENSGIDFKILNTLNGNPQHVRILAFDGSVDVYPATGTYKEQSGKFVRKSPDSFVHYLANLKPKISAIKAKSTDERIEDLEHYCAFLENEISQLKIIVDSLTKNVKSEYAPKYKAKPIINQDRVKQAIERGAEAKRQGKAESSNYYAGLNQPILFGHWQTGYHNEK